MRYYICYIIAGLLIGMLILGLEQKPHLKVSAPTHLHYSIYYQGDKLHEQIRL